MTRKQRMRVYEQFMHQVQLYALVHNQLKLSEAITLMCDWSYAHRVGNGEPGPRQQQRIVDQVVARMEKF